MFKVGDKVKLSDFGKSRLLTNIINIDHVKEFKNCVGIVLGPVDYGTSKGPEIDVRWLPSNLKYAYYESDLTIILEKSSETDQD